MPWNELFPPTIPEEEVEAILDTDDSFSPYHEVYEEWEAQYIAARRQLLGPVADITHRDFGRPNTPEETFAVLYSLKTALGVVLDEFDHKYHQRTVVQISEFIFDHNNNLVTLEE